MAEIDEAQTPKQATFRSEDDAYEPEAEAFISSGPSTPLSSPAFLDTTVFSPNESIATEITDYGSDSDAPKDDDDDLKILSYFRPPASHMLNQPAMDDPLDAQIPDTPSRRLSTQDSESAEFLEIRIDVPFLDPGENAPTVPGMKKEGPTIKEEDVDTQRPNLLSVWKAQPGGNETSHRRCSFSHKPTFDFMAEGRTHRGRPRAKSNIGVMSARLGQTETLPPVQKGRFLEAAEIQVGVQSLPASGWTMLRQEANTITNSTEETKGIPMSKYEPKFRESLCRVLPISTRERLGQDELHCVATTQGKERCRRKLKTIDSQAVLGILDGPTASESSSTLQIWEELRNLVLCGTHKRFAITALEYWDQESAGAHESDKQLLLKDWLETVRTGEKRLPNAIKTEPPSVIVDDDRPAQAQEPIRVILPDLKPGPISSPPEFVPYFTKAHDGKPPSQRLKELLLQPLTPGDVDHMGFIYIYWCEGKFGYVKIGFTKYIEKRLKNWETQCGRRLSRHFPLNSEDMLSVPHVHRVEQLVHAELGEYRRQENKCSSEKCGKKHVEWFETTRDVATEVVQKWIAWMRQLPYGEEMGRKVPQWVLREAHRDSIEALCVPSKCLTPKKPTLAVPRHKERQRRKSSGF